MFMVAMGIALIGYAFFPTAPPRMLPGEGFTDTLATFTSVEQDSNAVSLLVNKYAAVPSMHIGFSSMIAGTAVMLVRNPVGRVLWALYPVRRLRRDRRHRQPLLARRLRRPRWSPSPRPLIASRVLAPVRPEQWSFRGVRRGSNRLDQRAGR